jgi:uncharacterized lipoprotein NlpE involved in copper resistance
MRLRILPAIWIAASFSLVGCNDRVGLDGGVCSSLRQYSAEEQKAAAAEIRSNPQSQLAKFARDYGNLRKACRL